MAPTAFVGHARLFSEVDENKIEVSLNFHKRETVAGSG